MSKRRRWALAVVSGSGRTPTAPRVPGAADPVIRVVPSRSASQVHVPLSALVLATVPAPRPASPALPTSLEKGPPPGEGGSSSPPESPLQTPESDSKSLPRLVYTHLDTEGRASFRDIKPVRAWDHYRARAR